jgi:hypothetical protein
MLQEGFGPSRTPPLWPYLVLCVAVGSVVSLGSFHQGHISDTLIPVLVSLQKWTPFFWEQDRIGMLVPLLTLPLRNPLVNLLAQDAIYVSTALAAMFLLPRYMLRDGSYALAGTLSAVACLVLAPAAWFFGFTAFTFYGVWLALGLGGLVLAEARPGTPTPWWRWLLALGLVVLAHWVYSATALLLGPLVVARFLVCRQGTRVPDARGSNDRQSTWFSSVLTWIRQVLRTEFGTQLLLLSVGFGAGLLFVRLAIRHTPYQTDLSALPARQWPSTWRQLWHNGWSGLAPHHWPYFLFGTAFAGLVQLGVPARRRPAGVAWRAALTAGIAATVYFLFMGTRQWMVLNSCNTRYSYPWLFLLQGAFAILAAGQLTPAMSVRLSRRMYVLATAGLFLAALTSFHLPSVKRVHKDLDGTIGMRTADILEARCTHVAGDYWKVWPAVFHANLVLREKGEKGTVWGITLRGWPTRSQWQHLPLERIRVAVPLDDRETAEFWLQAFQLPPMVVVERRSTIYVLRPAAVVHREQQTPFASEKEEHESTKERITNEKSSCAVLSFRCSSIDSSSLQSRVPPHLTPVTLEHHPITVLQEMAGFLRLQDHRLRCQLVK